jgi:hypothetical protein
MAGLNPHAVCDFVNRKGSDPREEVGAEALMPGIQMLDDDDGGLNVRRQMLEEFPYGGQAAR